MDLAMILSPALEEEARAVNAPPPPSPSPPSLESNRNWSIDELQCAVAILQDFQQPSAEPPRDAAFYASPQEAREVTTGCERAADDDAEAAAARGETPSCRTLGPPEQHVPFFAKNMSKLDLLVQADAAIDHDRPQAPSSPLDDKCLHLRSGVWSRAEEEYAIALVEFFLDGLLDLPEGITLRKFVAEKLCCNRRRVSMKLGTGSLAGQKIPRKVGASVFIAADPAPSKKQREEIEIVLEGLRQASFDTGQWNSSRSDDKDGSFGHSQHRLTKGRGESEPLTCRKLTHHDRKKQMLKPKRGKPTIIRTGFESPEEEEFVITLFEFFMEGSLDIPEGTKLVRYLCQQLNCTSMQLSMKLAPPRMGERKLPDNVGSIRYVRKVTGAVSSDESDDDDFAEDLFEVESRITELRLAYEDARKSASSSTAVSIKPDRKSSVDSMSSAGTLSVADSPSVSPDPSFRRTGSWSYDEEVYAAALIDYFFKGVLRIAEGTTLRAFLSQRLCCNPMRISKKLASECIAETSIPKKLGSSTYVRNKEVTSEEQDEVEEILRGLQRACMQLSTGKSGGVLGSKRTRQSRGARHQLLAAAIKPGSGSYSHRAMGSYARDKLPKKHPRTAMAHTAAASARKEKRLRCHAPHSGSALVVPAPLKQQLA
ncbi:unnamed protein product [Hyaloperonospora brassicae]|uniref:Uncharacterized protein n=1 Tax=Hyaloperonospora brassicae TaxID=162125 RepID=A0AAV0ULR7_HYABA|nr:unnamed protein product [Hyaloperonospora brassicae]